jgi:hypothetical protein
MPTRPKPLPEDEFTESFLKGSGPGGQKIVSRRHLHVGCGIFCSDEHALIL